MRQLFWFWYALFLIGLLAVLAMMRSNSGAVLIMSFDGDAIHMAQIVLRMQAGQVPHLDFLTPLGAMAFLPIVWLMDLGFGVGGAFAYAPVMIALVMLPALYWVGLSRFAPSGALALGAVFLVQMLALVHGGVAPTVTASMYYNNWCWSVGALVVALAVVPSRFNNRWILLAEPMILGVGVGFLLLTKATFAVFLLPALILALLIGRQFKMLAFSVLWSMVFLTCITLPLGGLTYWPGYVQDLMFVANSAARGQPGAPLVLMLLAPAQLVGVLAVLTGIVFLRQARKSGSALVLLALVAGWVLITHQNWQNDPHWLIPAGVLVLALARDVELYNRFGWPLKRALQIVSVMLMTLGMPLLVTQIQSLLIHNSLRPDRFAAVFRSPANNDLRFRGAKDGDYRIDRPFTALASSGAKPTVLAGETLPDCQKSTGLVAELIETGKRLDQMPQTKGAQTLYADWINGLWLFSDTAPLTGGAPWYYGGTPGFAAAEFVVVPLCPMGQDVRRMVLSEIEQDPALSFSEVLRNDLFILLKQD
nr:hypothetical protein [Amylibacter sp.]